MILDLIEKDAHITQREIAQSIGIAVSLVNNYLDVYEKKGFIKRKYKSTKSVEYFMTKSGLERRKLLNIWYLNASYNVYLSAKDNIIMFLDQIIEKGFKRILLYGAGEVAEILLQVLNDYDKLPLKILAVIDDDTSKQDKKIVSKLIINLNQISDYNHDGILIASYKHHISIRNHLESIKYPKDKIIEFFQ
ncbi:MAG: winged helix-turn-helix transcriptional regulator [Acholeplasmataceae bacterium]|nr:winged helix-turn-helix transcriptional regulator [Acholeplasmataceae bacterium]